MTCKLTPAQKIKRAFWKYRVMIGFLCLAAGILMAMLLIEKETRERQADNREARLQLQREVEERIEKGEAHQEALDEQLSRLEKVNSVQNDIIRTLLGLRRNDPELFEGVKVPTPEEFAEQVGSEPMGSDQPIKDPRGGSAPGGSGGNEGRPDPGTGNGGNNPQPPNGSTDPDPPKPPKPPEPIVIDPLPSILPPIIIPIAEPEPEERDPLDDPALDIAYLALTSCYASRGT